MNRIYTTTNGVSMVECSPLNWEIEGKYCHISIGSLSEMWIAVYDLKNRILNFKSYNYSNDEVYRFSIDNLEEASDLVLRFAKGMKQEESIIDTIYWNPKKNSTHNIYPLININEKGNKNS